MALTQADLSILDEDGKKMVAFFDTIAVKVGNPKVEQQKQLMAQLVTQYSSPKLLEPEIQTCLFFKTKKAGKFVFAIEFQPHSPLRYCYEFVRIGLHGSGATMADGSPPRGPLFRDIPRA